MKLPAIPSLIGIKDIQLSRILSGIVQTMAIRFHGKGGADEQVVLQKELSPLLERERKGVTGSVGFVSNVRLVEGVLERKTQDVTFELGRVVSVGVETDWEV